MGTCWHIGTYHDWYKKWQWRGSVISSSIFCCSIFCCFFVSSIVYFVSRRLEDKTSTSNSNNKQQYGMRYDAWNMLSLNYWFDRAISWSYRTVTIKQCSKTASTTVYQIDVTNECSRMEYYYEYFQPPACWNIAFGCRVIFFLSSHRVDNEVFLCLAHPLF